MSDTLAAPAIQTTEEVDKLDVVSLRKHIKKMNTVEVYTKNYCRLYHYNPHPQTQLPFHNSHADERSIVLGTQQGKTTASGFEMAQQAIDFYMPWYKGKKHKVPPIERSQKFIGWFASVTSANVRDGAQAKLLGDISRKDAIGTGAIPLDYIENISKSRGIDNFIDTITLRRESGGYALLQSKTYEQSHLAYQGVPVDMLWFDEDPGYDDRIYNEGVGRTIATNGRIIVSLTPMLGLTPIRKRFIEAEAAGDTTKFQIRGGLDKALHIPKEEWDKHIAKFPEHERSARIWGLEMQGAGAVFTTPVDQLYYDRDPATFPLEWPVIWGSDLNHGGSHPFVAAFGFIDPYNDVIYINDLIVSKSPYPAVHISAIKQHPCWDAPFLYPHDGGRMGDMKSGDTIADLYRKSSDNPGGLNLGQDHVIFPDGGYSLEAGVVEMNQRFAEGRLVIAKKLAPLFTPQYSNYHRDDKLKIVRKDDDILDAVRTIIMGKRFAKSQYDLMGRRYNPRPSNLRARLDPDAPWGC